MLGDIVTIEWRGEEYDISPTIKQLRRVENDVNVMGLYIELESGEIPAASRVVTFFTHMLLIGGCNTTEEEVWAAMFGGEAANARKTLDACRDLMRAIFPPPIRKVDNAEKKPLPPKKSTRGRKSTK